MKLFDLDLSHFDYFDYGNYYDYCKFANEYISERVQLRAQLPDIRVFTWTNE